MMTRLICLCRQSKNYTRWLLLLCLVPVLWSCGFSSGVFEADDSAPRHHVDINSIPDAIPRKEPISRYGNPDSYYEMGQRYYVMESGEDYVEKGVASWYGSKFHGRRTSSGEIYDTYGMTAAHKTLPLPTYARVTNLHNFRSVIVKVNDRGPFVDNRLIDLSYAAAKKLGITKHGTGLVEIRAITPGKIKKSPYTQKTAIRLPIKSKPEDTRPPAAQNTDEQFFIQVAAFQDQQNAKRLFNKLEKMPVSKISIQEGLKNKRAIYRVRIGPVASMKLADELTDLLSQRGLTGSRIVSD